jgi:hypothetical protein
MTKSGLMTFSTMGETLASNSGVTMHLLSPKGTPLYAVETPDGWMATDDEELEGAVPCTFNVVGQDSRVYRRRRNELVDAVRARKRQLKAAEIEEEAIRLVAAGIVSWTNIPWTDKETGRGVLLEFTSDNLLQFLEVYRPAFDQANEFIAERANFLSKG